jgi:hypothetical protein
VHFRLRLRSRMLEHVTFPGVLLRLLTGPLVVYRYSILRAYAIGYLSSTTPRFISSLRQVLRKDLNYQQKREVVGCVSFVDSYLTLPFFFFFFLFLYFEVPDHSALVFP